MSVIDTKHLFEALPNRMKLASKLVRNMFPDAAQEAIAYELLQQGLLEKDAMTIVFDYWETVRELQSELQRLWEGPHVDVYILPIRNGALKNGVSYRKGICLFVSPLLTKQDLQTLFTHEYCHSCHRPNLSDPPTLIDSLITEGLAEYAVESLYGEEALNTWTVRYSHKEVMGYWQTHMKPKLYETGIHNHRALLMGGENGLPRWIGYCAGYRIVKAFLFKQGYQEVKDLLRIRTEEIALKAGFEMT